MRVVRDTEVQVLSVLKLVMAMLMAVVLIQALPAYYRSNEFDYFVSHETKGAVTEPQLRRDLLVKAHEYSLPVRDEDISISTVGRTYRIAVAYKVPIDLLIYSHELKFRILGGGLLSR